MIRLFRHAKGRFQGIQTGFEDIPSRVLWNCETCGSTVTDLGRHVQAEHPELAGEEPRRAWLLKQAKERE